MDEEAEEVCVGCILVCWLVDMLHIGSEETELGTHLRVACLVYEIRLAIVYLFISIRSRHT